MYKVLASNHSLYQHSSGKNQPVGSFPPGLFRVKLLSSKSTFFDMIIDELNSVIPSGLKSKTFIQRQRLFIKVTGKDGVDGLRDVLEYKQKSDTFFPTKAFQYTYAVLKCEAFVGEEKYELFLEESSNSICCNRPLLQAICDENESSSMVLTLCPVETERKLMTDSYMI